MRIKSKLIGQRIRQARLANNLSQLELAEELDLSVKAISAYEVGRVFPSVYTLKKIAQYTQLPIAYFLDDEGNEEIEIAFKLKRIEKELAEIKEWMKEHQKKATSSA